MNERNPFLPTFGNRPADIIGREDVLKKLEEGLRSVPGYPTRASVIIGQRGMGKTALLLELAERAEKHGFVAARVSANETMNEDIIQSIQLQGANYIKEGKRKLSGVNVNAFGFGGGLNFTEATERNFGFRVKLQLLCEELEKHKKGVFILVDEIQSTGPEMRELASTYQHLVGDGRNVGIAMAGLPHAMSSVLNDDILTFLNRAYHIKLDPLEISAIRQYYYKTLADLKKTASSDLIETLSKATKGYPFLFQIIGFTLLNYLENANQVTADIVQMTIEDSKEALVASVYAPIMKRLSENDLKFLLAMVQDEGASKISDIQMRLRKDNSQTQTYRLRLIAAGVVASPRRGELEITVPYFKEYLKKYES